VVTESGAILIYLARKTGKLMPRDLVGEAQVLRWAFAALNTLEVPLLSMWFVDINDGNGTRAHEAFHGWSDMRLKQLDGWLASRRFIATDDFTVADILMTHVLTAGSTDQSLLKPYQHVRTYQERCTGRPAWKRTCDAYRERVEVV
jgi:glutathione S-transferase